MTPVLIVLALILGVIVFLTYAGLLVNLTRAITQLVIETNAQTREQHEQYVYRQSRDAAYDKKVDENARIEQTRYETAVRQQEEQTEMVRIVNEQQKRAAEEADKFRAEQRDHMAKCEQRYLARLADAGEPTSHTH